MAGYSTISYKNKQILFFDHKGLKGKSLLDNYKSGSKFVENYNGNDILVLADFTDATDTKEMMDYINSKENKELMKKVKKTALLGITSAKMLLVNISNLLTGNQAKAFNTEEEAKEWLVN